MIEKDGKKEGVRLLSYDYSGLTIISIPAFELMIKQEIQRVKNLSITERVSQKWAEHHKHPQGQFWMKDCTKFLKRIDPVKN